MDQGRDDLIARLRELDEPGALAVVRARLAAGDDPLRIMEDCQEGVHQVGLCYEERRYFVSGLIMAGEILRQVVELVEPALGPPGPRDEGATVLLGTVQGDIHDIGKNIMHMLLRCNGFAVVDLGVDVAPAEFARQARSLRPRVVGLSALLTTTFDALRDTVAELRRLPAGEAPAVLIGGGMVDEIVSQAVGADGWARDAVEGLRLCRRLAAERDPT
ncbi:MAG: cobalamin B12-binding domain-containing protein [Deferrisomatales bacterium]